MPIYEYQCPSCETQFEALVRDSDSAVAQCPNCGTSEVNRLLSVFATANQSASSFEAMPQANGACGPASCTCGKYD